jgi:hypothetical protein
MLIIRSFTRNAMILCSLQPLQLRADFDTLAYRVSVPKGRGRPVFLEARAPPGIRGIGSSNLESNLRAGAAT